MNESRSENYAFYNSKTWRKKRLEALRRDKHECQICRRYGKSVKATQVHHIVEINEDWSLRLTLSNLTSLCGSCHNKMRVGRIDDFVWKK